MIDFYNGALSLVLVVLLVKQKEYLHLEWL